MVSEKATLLALALLAGLSFRAADTQEPFSPVWSVLLFGSLLCGVLLLRTLRRSQSG